MTLADRQCAASRGIADKSSDLSEVEGLIEELSTQLGRQVGLGDSIDDGGGRLIVLRAAIKALKTEVEDLGKRVELNSVLLIGKRLENRRIITRRVVL